LKAIFNFDYNNFGHNFGYIFESYKKVIIFKKKIHLFNNIIISKSGKNPFANYSQKNKSKININ